MIEEKTRRIARLRALWLAVRGDGCTNAPDLLYRHCCDRHDADYTTHCDESGRPLSRLKADQRLFECMKDASPLLGISHYILPSVYFLAVRAFGAPYWKKGRSEP